MYGYISELHGYGMTAEASGEQAEDLAATMLASTLGLDFDPEAAWNERNAARTITGFVRSPLPFFCFPRVLCSSFGTLALSTLPRRSEPTAGSCQHQIFPQLEGNNLDAPSSACAKADRIVHPEFRVEDRSC
jgi:hypothetical protein